MREICRRWEAQERFSRYRQQEYDSRKQLQLFHQMGTIQPEETATSEDVVKRIAYQNERFVELSKAYKLTPQWIRYGVKHAGEIFKIERHPLI